MTVAELIEALKAMPQDAVVFRPRAHTNGLELTKQSFDRVRTITHATIVEGEAVIFDFGHDAVERERLSLVWNALVT